MMHRKYFLKAVAIALKNGYVPEPAKDWTGLSVAEQRQFMEGIADMPTMYRIIIFDPEFAKAVWGNKNIMGDHGISGLAWMIHLERMAVSDNQLYYLGKNLDLYA